MKSFQTYKEFPTYKPVNKIIMQIMKRLRFDVNYEVQVTNFFSLQNNILIQKVLIADLPTGGVFENWINLMLGTSNNLQHAISIEDMLTKIVTIKIVTINKYSG